MGKRKNRNLIRGLPFFLSRRLFVLFGSVTILLIPAYYYHPSGLVPPLAVDGLLLMAVFLDFLIGPPTRKIQLQRPMPYPLAVDKSNEVSLEISNRTGRRVSIIIEDDVPPKTVADSLPLRAVVDPGSGNRLTYRLTPLERGDGEFGNIYFWVKGPLGLVWKRGEASAAMTVKLYPGLALIEKRKLRVWRPIVDEAVRGRWKRGAGAEFDSLREYVVGDDSSLIHWSTTARMGRPIVRQNRVERSQTVFLVLDAGRMMTARVLGRTKLDHGLNAALLVAYAALELGDGVGVMVVAQDVLCFLPPSRAPGQFGRILDATYALQPKMEEPRYYLALSTLATRLKKRALVLVLTDLIDERSSEGLIRYSLGLLPRHLPLVVAMSDTEVTALADSVPRDREDLYRQGVAAGILDRRERLMARLGSGGIMVMDTPPDRISIGTLDRYLEIKRRNLL